MKEPSVLDYQERPSFEEGYGQPPPPGTNAQGQLKFSPEELAVLAQCNQESFFQRSLPIGTALGLTTYVAVQKGHLKPNPRFGAYPKITLAVMMGYFIGKLSYQQACAEKLMALPGSNIGRLLRERKEGKISAPALRNQFPSMYGAVSTDIYTDAGPGSSLNLDTDRPLFNEESYFQDSDGASSNLPDLVPPRASLSYEELRRQNRGEQKAKDPYRIDDMPPISRRPTPSLPGPSTNSYGDVVE